ncbi:ABC transporter-like,P-loop containing nucleoside triphosphate hydrolase,AAA+ ATPase domain,ABC [Cinara cedri]|uniref:ABC transporter-like,P-loop containing nucleoside triphosphate hydrolase,AAA+ ATPase domain,ABC n=1 Tax=Cinara cedri TaxID=506608 RepID=A0A5E4MP88_9HEMI|nr:ABC transporter-like,P-loop containing nucleoside triphosphate hydrolase,AAA+ ATPase domain,ABC [Cinara cedri]
MAEKTLDLRYNEMWTAWNNAETGTEVYDDDDDSATLFKRDLVLSWKQLNVTVDKKIPKFFGRSEIARKQILDNVSGNVECGTLLGIMGPSGSGKTTLMATISHRTKGNFEGELLLNGRPVSEDIMIKISGFVAQEDISFNQLTVLEQLKLMAKLKMDRGATHKVIKDRIDHLAVHLGLNKILDTRLCYLSGGERKKVALAVQLINDPPILFCDEITTGLDSYSAAHIINTLRRVAQSGKIVICTIHQPASGVFDQFQEVILLTNGRLAYQGSVSLVNDLFQKYSYICPATYNKADFIVSILNSDSVIDKKNVNKMCELSSTVAQMDIKYNSFNKDVQSEYEHHLQAEKLHWILQVLLLLYRSATCFIRNYKEKLLEFVTLMFLGVITSTPYVNLQFDTKAVQNWEGFWLCLVINTVFQFSYSAIPLHQIKFSVVHREVSNKVYSLSAYYISELIVNSIWLMIKTVFFCLLVFWIVGVNWTYMQIVVFLIVTYASFTYGCLLSASCNRIEEAVVYSIVYEYLALPLSGAYLSFRSLPNILFNLRYLSLFFLGCESLSTLFWDKIKSLPCIEPANCLDSGKAVLNKFGFVSEDLYFDLMVLITFSLLGNIFSYFGIVQRMKKQPAY